jgi:hypothetical protein
VGLTASHRGTLPLNKKASWAIRRWRLPPLKSPLNPHRASHSLLCCGLINYFRWRLKSLLEHTPNDVAPVEEAREASCMLHTGDAFKRLVPRGLWAVAILIFCDRPTPPAGTCDCIRPVGLRRVSDCRAWEFTPKILLFFSIIPAHGVAARLELSSKPFRPHHAIAWRIT